MYPNLYYVFRDFFGVEWTFLRFINSFGFFVAIAFILGAITLTAELRRKSREGYFFPTELQVEVGKPATAGELILNFLLGFLLGYKIIALFIMDSAATEDPQAFIFSTIGSWPAGIILGLLFAGMKYWEKQKGRLPKPEKRKVRIWPQDRVGEITILALVLGLIGAKIFDIFENWSGFLQDPASYLFSPAGLTFYGGLILATIGIYFYIRKYRIAVWPFADAMAPTMMLAYAIGRIGCQVAGDGDWGIYNSAFQVNENAQISAAAPEKFNQTVSEHTVFFRDQMDSLGQVQHAYVPKPGFLNFLPDWMFAYDFPHNVNETGVPLAGCSDEKYCNHLPSPVFPTAFYEVVACLLLFALLWSLRKRIRLPGRIAALYLILNGMERFLIEKIRVNNPFLDLGSTVLTQAEVISFLLIIFGILLWIYLGRRGEKTRS